ncbi:MAG: hypothetical protein R3D55_23540 [Chloroflexota bacterium]
MKEAAIAAIAADVNQYAPANGRPALRQAIAQKVQNFYGIAANPDTEITGAARGHRSDLCHHFRARQSRG